MIKPVTRTIKYVDGWAVEISDTMHDFHHRVTHTLHDEVVVGQWVGYEHISQLHEMRHATNYFEGVLHNEVLFSTTELAKFMGTGS